MHILFLHQNFPAQFGPFLSRHAGRPGVRATFVSKTSDGPMANVDHIAYRPAGGATEKTHYSSRTFENVTWHSHAVYDVLKARPDVKPDLIVGHSGFLTCAPLRELYPGVPVLNYFEYFYHPTGSDMDFRPEWPPPVQDKVRARFRNAAILMDLYGCDAGYSPTHFQHSLLPAPFRDKVRVQFDGIDLSIWKRRGERTGPRQAGRFAVPDGVKLVTYAARGFESLRGFDVFMKFAKALYTRRPDVRFAVVGQDKVCYGGDLNRTGGKTYKEWVLAQDEYDLSKFAFVGRVPPADLAAFFAITDLHVYLTAPFVLSWSLLNALSCGAVVLASDTPPVREVVENGTTGLLAGFFDHEAMAETACRVLDDPAAFAPLGAAAADMVRERYDLDACYPRLLRLYEDVANGRTAAMGRG